MRPSILVSVTFSLVVLVGCGKGDFSKKASVGKANTFRYPVASSITGLDPSKSYDSDTLDVLQQVFEGLAKWNEHNQVVPNIAEKWDISKDGMTYTFTLKHGVRFHNGREVKAEDFKYTLERESNPAFGSESAPSYLSVVQGFKDRLANRATELRGVQVIDDYHLAITTEKPCPYFLSLMTFPNYWVVCKEALDHGKEITTTAQMVGTGPFKAESYKPTEIVTLVSNKDYHDGAPSIDRIERPIIRDPETRLNKFKSGELDLTRIERQDVEGLVKDPLLKDQIHYFERPVLNYVGLNCKTYPPFRDRNVRRAFAMAINMPKVVDEILGGTGPEGKCKVAKSILPPSMWGFRANAAAIPFDMAEARRLLAAAGYPGGKGLPPLTMFHRDGQTDAERITVAIVTELRQNLGVDCNAKMVPWGQYLEMTNKHQMDMYLSGWGADYLDPQDFISLLFTTDGSENRIDYSNLQVDADCHKADVMVGDDTERLKLYAEAEDLILQDAPLIPIYISKDAELVSPRVQGIRNSAFGHLPHSKLSLQ